MVKRSRGASTNVIATRVLIGARGAKRVMVKLWAPAEEAQEEWSCAFHITGMRKPKRAFGIDAFQALSMALEGIRVRLAERGGTYTWHGGGQGDAGFPQMIPQYLGIDFSARVARLIEREERSFTRRKTRRKS